jgi:hypothetical protein
MSSNLSRAVVITVSFVSMWFLLYGSWYGGKVLQFHDIPSRQMGQAAILLISKQ